MRKYYLFIIKDKYKNRNVFNTLNNLYNVKGNNLSYGLKVYNEICDVFDKDIISNYLEKRFQTIVKLKKDKYYINGTKERDLITLKYSTVIIMSNINFPLILRTFNCYNKNIFVCDFDNQDYFWLNDMVLAYKN